jgi:hypothetical protein
VELGVQQLGVQQLGVQQLGFQQLGFQQLGIEQLGLQQLGVEQLGVEQLGFQQFGLRFGLRLCSSLFRDYGQRDSGAVRVERRIRHRDDRQRAGQHDAGG